MARQVWVALTPIWQGYIRAFNPGDIVPDTVEARYDYSGQGLVARITLEDDEGPTLEAAGVAFKGEVVLKTSLHIGPTPPTEPRLGQVWIDTSL